jgi:acetyl esterase/lipase
MPVGFILTVALVGLCTVAALVRPPRFGKVAYLLAVVVNELPHLAALYLLLATALAWVEDDLRGVTGAVLLVLAGATLAGHVELVRRGLTADTAVRRGLAGAGIGLPANPVGRTLRPLLAPFPVRPRRVRRLRGVRYGEHRRQRLDVYGLRHRQEAGPVLVHLHGGGYFSGGRHREARALLHRLASRGWVCVSAGYRLRPSAGFTDHLEDARAVVAWAHAHAGQHGGDADRLVMAGSSAGAHLTALCALTQHEQPDPATSRIDAAVGLYGYYGRYYGRAADETPVSSPLHLDASAAPPFFLVHGDHDSYVHVELARAFERHLRAQSRREVVYAELPGAQHGFDLFRSWRFSAVIDGLEAFLDATSASGATRRPPTPHATTARR